jgi:hypothetical protein
MSIVERLRASMAGVTRGPWHRHEWDGAIKQTDLRTTEGKTVAQIPWDRDTGCSAHRDAAYIALCSPDNIGPLLDLAARAESAESALAEAVAVMERVKAFHDKDEGHNAFTAEYEGLRAEIDATLTKIKERQP